MRPAHAILAGVIALVTTASRAEPQAPPQQPPPITFRATTDVVEVEVSVTSAGQPVGGLRPEAFKLLDNGIPQTVESVELSALPVDVSLLVDVSGGTTGAWRTPRPTAETQARVSENVDLIRAMLRPGDRMRVVTIDTAPREIVPLAPIDAMPAPARFDHGGLSSVYDAMAEALMRPLGTGRRHFVFVRTTALDTMSVLDAAAVRDIASRSDAVLHIVQDDATILAENNLQDCQCAFMALCRPTQRFWLPIARRPPKPGKCNSPFEVPDTEPRSPETVATLGQAAILTGGRLHEPGLFATHDVVATFRETFDAYRRSYLLRYSPAGVERVGRHTIEVSVPSQPSFAISARAGYWVDPPLRPRTVRPPTVADTLADRFDAGDMIGFETVVNEQRDVAALLRTVRTSPPVRPADGRRDGAFAIELARVALWHDDSRAQEEALRLLAHYHGLMRHPIAPDGLECGWYWAGAAMLTGLVRPAQATPFIERALARCREPRLLLALAVVADQRSPFGTTASGELQPPGLLPTAVQRSETLRRYEEAAAHEDVAAEARVRGAWLLHRTGDHAQAIEWLDRAAVPAADRYVGYIEALVRGEVLRALDRRDDAEVAFRRALEIWPRAQSARIALMTLLVQAGRGADASSLATAVQAEDDTAWDPWWQYWQGDFRSYHAILAHLKRLGP